jgi:hypothetical protein
MWLGSVRDGAASGPGRHPGGGPAGAALASPSPSGASWTTVSPPLSPRLASCCNIVMGLVMGYMLIISR